MEMLSNGYGCIKKCSKTIKKSLFDWILPKFYKLLFKKMSDLPTASTSTASTSSESPASTSRTNLNPYTFRCINAEDLDCSTTEESEVESDTSDEESPNSNEDEHMYEESDDNMENTSWSSTVSSAVSCEENTTSEETETSETETTLYKERFMGEQKPIDNDHVFIPDEDVKNLPIIVFVQMNELGMELLNVEEHAKRLKTLEKELEFIESTAWMYRPIDSAIQ